MHWFDCDVVPLGLLAPHVTKNTHISRTGDEVAGAQCCVTPARASGSFGCDDGNCSEKVRSFLVLHLRKKNSIKNSAFATCSLLHTSFINALQLFLQLFVAWKRVNIKFCSIPSYDFKAVQ